jgi:hypothetical protein
MSAADRSTSPMITAVVSNSVTLDVTDEVMAEVG